MLLADNCRELSIRLMLSCFSLRRVILGTAVSKRHGADIDQRLAPIYLAMEIGLDKLPFYGVSVQEYWLVR